MLYINGVKYVTHGTIMAGVRLNEETESRLASVSARMGRPKSVLIRQAILEKLEEWEDLASAIEALENPGRTWTLEELEQGTDLRPDDLEG